MDLLEKKSALFTQKHAKNSAKTSKLKSELEKKGKEVKNDKTDKNVVEIIETGSEVIEKTATKTTNKVVNNGTNKKTK